MGTLLVPTPSQGTPSTPYYVFTRTCSLFYECIIMRSSVSSLSLCGLALSDVKYLEYVWCNLLMVPTLGLLSPSQWSHWSKVNIIPLTVPSWPGQCFDQFLPGFQFRHSGVRPAWNWPSQHLERSQSHHELLRAFVSLRSAGGEEVFGQSWRRRQWSGKWLVGPS